MSKTIAREGLAVAVLLCVAWQGQRWFVPLAHAQTPSTSSRPSAETMPATTRPTLAIAPFEVLGETKVKDAGAILAERLLPLLAEHYQIVDQAHLKEFLQQDDLTIAGLVEKTGRQKAVKMRAVRYLVVGSVSASGDTWSATARISDWQTGDVQDKRIARISAESWEELISKVPALGAKLVAGPSSQPQDGQVERKGDTLVVTVDAYGKDQLDRVQKARQKSRAIFAKYMTTELKSPLSGDQLLEHARSREKLVDAVEDEGRLHYVVQFPIPTNTKPSGDKS